MPPRGGGGPPLHQTHFALHHFAFHFALQQLFTLHHLAAAGAKGKASRRFRVQFGANEDCLHRKKAGWWFNSGYLDGMPSAERRMYDQGCTITLCHCDFEYRFIFILVPDVQLEVEVIFSQEESSLYPLASLSLSEGQNFQCLFICFSFFRRPSRK